ncbi:hypothetical protein LTR47_004831 [Exophiala xenobiotica]|nr:hypothetical protein LTR47_004831 [Exophiala xenobiotica]KAK5245789.1 hypothetical protein LTS06_008813 [Exophiala xenobiotica]KAK5352917.1 hypothetical protein LTR61_004045 [Exophiala xenobiotica]KAK5375782.1 hypothetical protein LTR11_005334 [Exophiala xenobiotica]KAK5390968.1 hypothetical protein LTS03_000339 [Exophiala xenobiotica]
MPSTSGRGGHRRQTSYNSRSNPVHSTGGRQSHRRQTRPRGLAKSLHTPSITSSSARTFPGRPLLFSEGPAQSHITEAARTPPPDDDFGDQIIMAVNIGPKNRVGCAYYIAGEERLLCMEEVVDRGMDIIERLKIDIQPTTVIVSPRYDGAADGSDSRNRRPVSLVDSVDDQQPLPYEIEVRPSAEFSYDAAVNKILSLPSSDSCVDNSQLLVPGEPIFYEEDLHHDELGLTKRRGRLLQISTWLDLDNRIIQPEATAFKQNTGALRAKENAISIYALFHTYTRSPQGKTLLRQAFLRPSLDIDYINSRLDFVSVFVRPENQMQRQGISKSLGKIRNMRNTMTLLHKGIESAKQKVNAFKGGVWSSLLEFCYHTIDVADTLREVIGADHLPLCVRAVEVLDRHSLQRIGRVIHETVDVELSNEQQRTVVKRGINEQLDEVKDVYDGMDEILSEKAIQIAKSVGLNIELNVIYFPHLGFHVTIPLDETTHEPSSDASTQASALGWQHMFTTDRQVYYKDQTMREMDEELGDLYAEICDYEIEIAYDLAQRILEDEKVLIAASDLCGQLDCNLAFAHCAHEYSLTRPRITEDNVIDIQRGRHLLQEKYVPSFVPNDTFIQGGGGKDDHDPTNPCMLLLTGPNYSGKSVYQKQVALAVYMAQIGSFLPAESATIGITDKILTRITTRETVSKVQSAFMIDMQQIAMALNSCTRRSLVVIDEFGKGTDTCDGAGLAAGVFLHLVSLESEAPKALVATHFHEIFDIKLFDDLKNISFAHMEVRVDAENVSSATACQSQVTYLYNLRPGRSDLSYGTQCAAMNGISEHIVERACELAQLSSRGEDLVSHGSVLSKDDAVELEFAESAAELFMGQDFEREMTRDELLGILDAMLERSAEEMEELSM